jgi:hypothetical protein
MVPDTLSFENLGSRPTYSFLVINVHNKSLTSALFLSSVEQNPHINVKY